MKRYYIGCFDEGVLEGEEVVEFEAWGSEVVIESYGASIILQSFLDRVRDELEDRLLEDGSERNEVLRSRCECVDRVEGVREAFRVFESVLNDIVLADNGFG